MRRNKPQIRSYRAGMTTFTAQQMRSMREEIVGTWRRMIYDED